MKYLTIFFTLLLSSCFCFAGVRSASDLKADCEIYIRQEDNGKKTFDSVAEGYASVRCLNYVMGWADATQFSPFVGEGNKQWYLQFSDGVTPDQIVRVFVKFVEENPTWLNKDAPTALIQSVAKPGLILKYPVIPAPVSN